MFKNRNNTQTNKHRAFIGWFGEVENILTEYGNVEDINDKVFFDGRERPKFPKFYKELSSKQYGLIGQEYAEYIRHIAIGEMGFLPGIIEHCRNGEVIGKGKIPNV